MPYITPTKVFFISLLVLFSCKAFAQTLDSLVLIEVANLKEKNPAAAEKQLITALETTATKLSNHQKADLYSRHRYSYLSLTKNKRARNDYSLKIINWREQSNPLDTLGLIDSYLEYGSELLDRRVDYYEALRYIEKAQQTWELYFSKPTNLYATINNLKAATLTNLGRDNESLRQYEKTIAIYDVLPERDEGMISALQIGLAKNLIRYGFYDRADFYLSKVESIYDRNVEYFRAAEKKGSNEYAYRMDLMATKCRLAFEQVDEDKLLAFIDQVEQFKKDKTFSKRANYYTSSTYNYAGLFYLEKKERPSKALDYFTKAKAVTPKDFMPVYVDYYSLNMAKAKYSQGNLDQALKELNYLDREKKLPRKLKGFLYATRSKIHVDEGSLTAAIDDANLAIQSFSKGEINQSLGDRGIVSEFTPSSSLNDALQLSQIADAFFKAIKVNPDLVIITNNLYKVALKQFKNSYRKRLFSAKLESIFDKITNRILKTNQLKDGQYDVDNFLIDEITNYKSRFLWHNFLINNQSDHFAIPDSLLSLKRGLQSELQVLNNSEENKNNNLELAQTVNQKIQSIEAEIESSYASFQHFSQYEFSSKEFIQTLGAGEVVLKYFVLEDDVYLSRFSGNTSELLNLGSYAEMSSKVDNFISCIESQCREIKSVGYELTTSLGLSTDKENRSIVIVPDKILCYLPFEALSNGSNYLIEDHTISYASSLNFLNDKKKKASQAVKANPLVFAPAYQRVDLSGQGIALRNDTFNLKGASEEGRVVGELINGKTYLEQDATKMNFLAAINKHNVMHLAMHAFLDNENPDQSHLLFTDYSPDHKLFLSDLYQYDLDADLVVLSACNTGVGSFESGKGMVSMNNAFTYAGVPASVSSLWSVPDLATKQMMVEFYKYLEGGEVTTEALRLAKLDYLKNTEAAQLQHPFYWAGFVHYGKTINLDFGSSQKIAWLLAIGIIISLGFIFAFFQYKQ